jgi:DNA-binding GntR family transcriptional regulator
LTTDEALVFRSARDIRIPIMNEARYLEIRTIRLRLEAIAAEAAAQIATPRDLDAIGALVSENALALKAQDYARCTELNQQFHFLLPTIARLPVLHGILRRLWLQMGPTIAHSYPAGGSSMVDWHYPVLEALRKRDSTAAAQAIMDDIYHGGLTILSHVQKRATVPAWRGHFKTLLRFLRDRNSREGRAGHVLRGPFPGAVPWFRTAATASGRTAAAWSDRRVRRQRHSARAQAAAWTGCRAYRTRW